jgi:OHCU decarboxylase
MTLDELNLLPTYQAQTEFLKCCGSTRWAQAIAQARPFASVDELLEKADAVWWSLSKEDWQEAFRAHPKIGEKKAAANQSKQARNWSAQEQTGVTNSSLDTIAALAKGNREYEQRFGFIFIVCATGKSSEEMLAILESRLQNDPVNEMRAAAGEQAKITKLRLEKLLTQ